jgi:hypothetical protein
MLVKARSALAWGGGIAAVIILGLVGVVVYGYVTKPGWVGVADKTLWDWLQLLVVPAVLAAGGLLLNTAQRSRELVAQEVQKHREEYIQDQRAQDDALQAYLDYVSKLLIDEVVVSPDAQAQTERATSTKFVSSLIEMNAKNPQLFTVIRVRTLAVLTRLDAYRKPYVLGFLYESGLIYREVEEQPPALELSGADLSDIDLGQSSFDGICLSQTYMSGAILAGISLRDADLSGVDLSGADLSGADLSGANLSGAYKLTGDRSKQEITTKELESHVKSLKGTTMPDGSKHD